MPIDNSSNAINGIRNRLFGSGGHRELTPEDIPEVHHRFMVVYGWIPLKEFKRIPIGTLLTLLPFVQKEYEKKEHLRLVHLKFCGVKNPK